MKKLAMSLTGIVTVLFSYSQNVGIGTNTPVAKLDIRSGSQYVAQFNGASSMFVGITENDIQRGYWGSFSGAAEDVDFGTASGNLSGKIHLAIQASPKLTINSSGMVGIGTTSPAHLLHINGGDLFVESGSGKIVLGYETGNQWRFGTTAAGADMHLYTYNGVTETPMHYFHQNGNVGIGTGLSAPVAKLEVRGTGFSSFSSTFIIRNNDGDTLLRVKNDGRMGIGYNGETYGRTINLGGTGINFYTSNEHAFGGAIFPTDTSLVIWANDEPLNYLVLQPSWGNTGIGTYTPNAKLHLNTSQGVMLIGNNSARVAAGYELSVDGEIMCENLVMQNSTLWPDYVFEDDYRLMPIEDLEKSIRQNKHLPNVPSAADIEKNGISMSEMTKALLEKVEELTLYIIQLKKENDEMKSWRMKMEKKPD